MADLAEVVEVKRRLSGAVARFHHERIANGPGKLVVRYRPPTGTTLLGVEATSGSFSFAYFWEDRPFNVHHGMRPDGTTVAWYCNVADSTVITPDRVIWRDLAVDLFVVPGRAPRILDEEELPPDLDPRLRAYVDAALATLLEQHPALFADLERESAGYLAGLQGT